MKIINIDTQRAEQTFAETAAEHFAANPQHDSFTNGDIEAGCYLALRWGAHRRAVAVVKLDEFHSPVIYGDLVPYATTPPSAPSSPADDDVPF